MYNLQKFLELNYGKNYLDSKKEIQTIILFCLIYE
jgi:hypothetical protein